MIKDALNDCQSRMDSAVKHTHQELVKIRTGRANPELVEGIQVEYYGTKMPLNQVSTITVPEPRLISVQPFEKNLIPVIEKAIMESNLGLTPSNNGTSVLIPIPQLSEERRRDLTKVVHQMVEEGRIAVRNVRRDVIHHLKSMMKEDHISEDEIKRAEDEVQKLTDTHIEQLNQIQSAKEEEILNF
ncbi:MAG: ribosome recycling factor [Candidatus Neomarinimicrobiota bacterium]|nr:MAG: ribosome recycling factor [Candidatus Neomarinimicrobiota bacterium]